jgi:hypothetical protein
LGVMDAADTLIDVLDSGTPMNPMSIGSSPSHGVSHWDTLVSNRSRQLDRRTNSGGFSNSILFFN